MGQKRKITVKSTPLSELTNIVNNVINKYGISKYLIDFDDDLILLNKIKPKVINIKTDTNKLRDFLESNLSQFSSLLHEGAGLGLLLEVQKAEKIMDDALKSLNANIQSFNKFQNGLLEDREVENSIRIAKGGNYPEQRKRYADTYCDPLGRNRRIFTY